MDQLLSRRSLIGAGLSLPVLALAGCAGGFPAFSFEDAIRRLLTVSSQRAFAQLLTDEGFFRDDVARVQLPSQLGGSAVTRALAVALGTSAVQDRLLRLVNVAASQAADAAAPIVYDSIRTMSIADAAALVRGGPTAATDFLQQTMGDAIVDAMFPQVGEALRIADNGLVSRVLQVATGINFSGLQADVSRKAASGIYRAIGREEAAIRANPQGAGDPVIAGVFGILGR
jgi:hypothetical protein